MVRRHSGCSGSLVDRVIAAAAGTGGCLAGPAGEVGVVAGAGGADLFLQAGLGVLVSGDLGGVGGGILAHPGHG